MNLDIIEIFNQLAFPLAMCLLMAYYVKYITDHNREDINNLNQQHREAEQKITEAINNNTLVMTRLCERMGEAMPNESNN